MADDSDLERTEPATGRRIQRAREDGKVVQSRELSTFLGLITAIGALILFGNYFMDQLIAVMRRGFTLDRLSAFDRTQMMARFSQDTADALVTFSPLLGLLVIAAIAGPLLLAGWNLSWKPLTPNFSKINPMSGIKRIFSVNGLMEMGKAVLKAVFIGGTAVWVIWHYKEQIFMLATESLGNGLSHMGDLILTTALFIVSPMLLIVLADVPFQMWNYAKGLRMTKEEVRQESKETEGDPQIKARIRSMQRAAARKRMMAAVPKADVIVTNPTHFAIALQYEQGNMGAPRVIAKGMGLLAERIMELGRENRVPMLQAPPLARALYRHAEVGDEIPQRLYTAVAEVLAYVYQLRDPKLAAQRPTAPRDLPVPADMDYPEYAGVQA